MNWSYVYFGWQIVPKPLRTAAREALKVTDKQRVIAAFTNLLHTTISRVTLRQAAAELGKLDTGNKTAIAALILLLDVSKDEHTQQRIIYSLANIGHGNENAVKALISFLTATSNVYLCWDAITALGAIGKGNQQAITYLVERLKNNACQNDDDYFQTATTLWEIDTGNLVAEDAFIKVLAATNDGHLISEITDYLLKINFDSQTVIATLSHKLRHESEDIRLNCSFDLAKLDVNNQAAKQTLIDIISKTEDSGLENRALRYLLQYYPSYEDTISTFSTTHISENRYFFRTITQNIEAKGSTNLTNIDFLIFIMQESLSKNDCQYAINLLKCLDLADDILGRDKVITALNTFLQKNRGDVICLFAANTLLSIDPGNQTAINILIEILELNRCEWVCDEATTMLLRGGYYHQKVVENLINSVSSEKLFFSGDMWKASRYLELIKENENYKNVLDSIITHYLKLFQNFSAPECEQNSINPCEGFSYSYQLVESSEKLLHTLQLQYLPKVVTCLKGYLDNSSYNSSSYRYEAVYNLIWYCAQNLTYADFCNALQN